MYNFGPNLKKIKISPSRDIFWDVERLKERTDAAYYFDYGIGLQFPPKYSANQLPKWIFLKPTYEHCYEYEMGKANPIP